LFIRTLLVIFTASALWWSSSSFGLGLGLGELKVDSNLAAPLKASVILRGMNGIDFDAEQFSIRIDSDSKPKIEYRLLRIDADTAIIRLYTREIISNPLFQFRVEVKWDSSTVARSYDVLVDPPAYEEYFRNTNEPKIAESVARLPTLSTSQIDEGPADNKNALPVETAIALSNDSAPETPAITADTEKLVGESVVIETTAVDFNSASFQQRREYGPTINGNSIWRVARAVATDNPDLTIYQWMYAIWNNNPDAFTRNNMHQLKMGEVLGIPFEEQVAATSHSSAWRAYSEQMAGLQTASPVKADNAGVTTVDAKRDVPAVTEVQEMDVQQTVLATDAAQLSNPGEAVVNEFSSNTELESEIFAAEGSIIALLEKSASTVDEKSVVTRESGVPGSTAETTMPIDPITADGLPGSDSNGISSSAEVDSTNQIGGAEATRVELNEDPILLDSLDAEMTGNSLSTAAVEKEIAVDAAPVVARVQEMPEWARALQERYDHINQLPVIGTDGTLSFVGRSVQAADRFIATRPSWATLAFGIWATLVLLMLRQEILLRRKTAVAASPASRPEALEADEAAKNKTAEHDSDRVSGEVEQATKPVALPKAPPAPSNASAILAQANAILARGDTEEAIKLMRLAVDLQPDQPTLVVFLLELYHRTRSTELFDELIDRSRWVLEALDSSDQTRLEVMHGQLCPDATFPLGRGEPVANHEMPVEDNLDGNNTDTESESVSGPVAGIGTPSDPDPIDASEDRALLKTQVLFPDNDVSLREGATPMPGMVGEIIDLEVTLNEADVYLAYGLYENAEYLLLKGMEVDPERTDFLARLLDSYYATRNVVDFVTCAEVMQDMGEAGAEYWERVEIMGYELAPYNNLFADGKDKSLSPVELEIPKPESADFEFSDIDESSESAFTDIEIGQDDESHLSESTIADVQIGKYLDDDSEPADFEFSDIDESDESAVIDSEIAQDDESTLSESTLSESTFTDIQIGKYLDADSEPTYLNLDLEAHQLIDESDSSLDGLINELDDLSETDESGMAGDNESLEINLDATTDDSTPVLTASFEAIEDELEAPLANKAADDDESFEVNPDATTDGFDPALTVDLEAAEDELKASIADELEDDDEGIDLDYGDEDAIQFTMGQDSQGDELKSEQFTPVDSDDASLELLDDPTVDTLFGVKLGSDNSRILYFPDSPSEDRDIDKFESEVKTTLQAIRDQLQNMTERLFQQERTTNDLKQTIAELKSENMPVAKNIKESS